MANPTPCVLTVSLVTRGSPEQPTGGHLYHQRIAASAPAHQACVEFVQASTWRNPLRATRGLPVIDSITAWSVAPWLWGRPPTGAIAAIVHQPPGGIDHGAFRAALQRPLDQSLYRRCALVIAASTALGDELADRHGVPAERIEVVEPGSDLPVPTSPPADLRRGRRLAVLTVANWLPNKGIVDLLDAVAGLPADTVTLHLVGSDELDHAYAGRVRARLGAPDLVGRVIVHGALGRHDVAAMYRDADAFVLPSRLETYGTVYAEALRAGLPTVGCRSGNLRNLITEGQEGCLLPPGDVTALRDVLGRLATDEGWRATLAAAACRRGCLLPAWEDTAAAFFGALRGLSSHS